MSKEILIAECRQCRSGRQQFESKSDQLQWAQSHLEHVGCYCYVKAVK